MIGGYEMQELHIRKEELEEEIEYLEAIKLYSIDIEAIENELNNLNIELDCKKREIENYGGSL